MSVKLRIAALAVSTAALLTLAGCGGDDPLEESANPGSTSSAAPSNGAVAATDEVPEAAKENTAAGGVAFVKYYFDQVNRGFETGDYDHLAELTDSGCIICRQTIGDIAFAYAVGEVKGGKVTLTEVKSEKTTPDLNSVSFKYAAEKYTEVDGAGNTIFTVEPRNLEFVVQVKWTDAGWVMSQIVQGTVAES